MKPATAGDTGLQVIYKSSTSHLQVIYKSSTSHLQVIYKSSTSHLLRRVHCLDEVLDYRVGLPPHFQCLVMSCECICIKCLKPTLEQGQKFIKMSFGRLFSAVNARSLVLIRLNRLEIRRLLSRRL